MKALELTVYPKFDHDWNIDKRLTDEELAAEYWRAAFLRENSVAENDGYDGSPDTRAHLHQARILRRFATLPHYDEVTA